MSLSVSVNGGDRVPAKDVILYDDGIPIAGAMEHGNIVIYADCVRDYHDFIQMLNTLGVRLAPARKANIKLHGAMG